MGGRLGIPHPGHGQRKLDRRRRPGRERDAGPLLGGQGRGRRRAVLASCNSGGGRRGVTHSEHVCLTVRSDGRRRNHRRRGRLGGIARAGPVPRASGASAQFFGAASCWLRGVETLGELPMAEALSWREPEFARLPPRGLSRKTSRSGDRQHISQFWSRRMRGDFVAAFDAGSHDIQPLLRRALVQSGRRGTKSRGVARATHPG